MRSFFSRAGSVGASVAIALGSLGLVTVSGVKLHPAHANSQSQSLLTAKPAIGPSGLSGLKGGEPIPAPNPNAVAPDGQPLSRDVEVPLAAPTALTPGSALGTDWQLFGNRGDRRNLLKSIDYSLRYMGTASSVEAYRNYPMEEVTHGRVVRSLRRFRELVVDRKSTRLNSSH